MENPIKIGDFGVLFLETMTSDQTFEDFLVMAWCQFQVQQPAVFLKKPAVAAGALGKTCH